MAENETAATDTEVDTASWAERETAQAAAYTEIGDRYDEAFPHKEGQVELVKRLLPTLPPEAHVLDLGCGTGLPTARQLVDAGCRVTGMEIATGMLDLARRNVPEARFLQGDMVDLDPERGKYDAVIACFSLLHLTRERIPQVLNLIHETLVPGGRLCLAMVEADLDDFPIPFLGLPLRVTGYFREELREILCTAGFSIEHEKAISYAPSTTQAEPEIQLFSICRRED